MLSDLSREIVNVGEGKRQKRVARSVYRIGKIGDVANYSSGRTPEAIAYVKFRRLEIRWAAMRADEQVGALEMCSLPSVAVGRAVLALAETKSILHELDELIGASHLGAALRREAEGLREVMSEIADRARDWLKLRGKRDQSISATVRMTIPGWTAAELLEVIRPLYPRARNIKKPTRLVSLIGDYVRRVQNPDYKRRFSKDPREAAEYLYDRTDALLFIAKEWGGNECCLQATLAGNELCWLRDPRFVIPALEMPDFNARLAAVACLAFLWSDEGNERLYTTAVRDPDPGVRQSALWAYGFAGGVGAADLLEARSNNDADVRVRAFAKEVLKVSEESWWKL